jgi:hypothetical protein
MTAVVPLYVNQAYLVLTSNIVAWQVSHFDPWTAWVLQLLVILVLYDLFAVLTPCGPLLNLMQRDDAPAMPSLLYEASFANAEQSTTNRLSQQRSQSQQNRVRSNNNNNNHVGTNESDEPTNADTSTAAPVISIQSETASTTMYVATVDANVNSVLPTSDEPTTYVSYDVDTGEGMRGVLPHGYRNIFHRHWQNCISYPFGMTHSLHGSPMLHPYVEIILQPYHQLLHRAYHHCRRRRRRVLLI